METGRKILALLAQQNFVSINNFSGNICSFKWLLDPLINWRILERTLRLGGISHGTVVRATPPYRCRTVVPKCENVIRWFLFLLTKKIRKTLCCGYGESLTRDFWERADVCGVNYGCGAWRKNWLQWSTTLVSEILRIEFVAVQILYNITHQWLISRNYLLVNLPPTAQNWYP